MKKLSTPSPLLFLCALTLGACGEAPEYDEPQQYYDLQEEDDADELFKKSEIRCQDTPEAPCSQSTAFLTYIIRDRRLNPASVGSCTGFYLGNRVLMTNHHCIPQHLKAYPEQCQSDYQANFLNGEKIKCKRIISTSRALVSQKGNLDYAFIELETEPNVPALKISTHGILETEKLFIPSVDPYLSNEKLLGVMRPRKCTAAINTVWIPRFNSKNPLRMRTPIMPTIGCDNIGGNSGSPVLDASGEVRAILHSIILNNEIESRLPDLFLDKKTRSIGFTTNFACFSEVDPTSILNKRFHYNIDSACIHEDHFDRTSDFVSNLKKRLNESDMKSKQQELVRSVFSKLNDRIQSEELLHNNVIKLTINTDTSYPSFGIQAECIRNISQYKMGDSSSWHRFKSEADLYPNLASIRMNKLPRFFYKIGIDENHAPDMRIQEEVYDVILEFSPKELYSKKSSFLRDNTSRSRSNRTISICK